MEFWLSFNNGVEKLQLPVPPPSFEISNGNNNTTVNINDIGEINLIGKGRLATITINSFFPAQQYPFCQYSGFPTPYDCVSMIERWRTSGKPIRLIITDTDVNIAATIENFNYGEQDGTRDVYFTLELKEYRFISVTSSAVMVNKSGGLMQKAPKRPTEKQVPKQYVIRSGDTLYTIAKRLTGNGANYKTIAAKNGIKDPNKINVGQKLVIV